MNVFWVRPLEYWALGHRLAQMTQIEIKSFVGTRIDADYTDID